MFFRIKAGKINARANREGGNHFPRVCIHHDYLRLVAGTDEQAIGLGIVSETCWNFRYADREAFLDFQRLRIKCYYLVAVLEVDVDQTMRAYHCLFAVA